MLQRYCVESRLCADSETVGSSTIDLMGQQRGQLQITSDHLHETIKHVEDAKVILKDMSWRAIRNKIFLYFVIMLLIVANGYVLYRISKK